MTKVVDKIRKKTARYGLAVLFVVVFGASYFVTRHKSQKNEESVNLQKIEYAAFTESELSKFDGSDGSAPIYLALNGLVYDVSTGRDFYKTDGPYHYLAGKDSSDELNLVGGEIIKKKYPVIGRLIK